MNKNENVVMSKVVELGFDLAGLSVFNYTRPGEARVDAGRGKYNPDMLGVGFWLGDMLARTILLTVGAGVEGYLFVGALHFLDRNFVVAVTPTLDKMVDKFGNDDLG